MTLDRFLGVAIWAFIAFAVVTTYLGRNDSKFAPGYKDFEPSIHDGYDARWWDTSPE